LGQALLQIGRDLLAPIALAAAVALAFLPAPRAIAWVALLLLSTTLGLIARPMGVTAAVASAMLFMTVHDGPRFASTITDAWTIRASFLLGVLGAMTAAATSSWAHRAQRAKAHSRVEHSSSRRIRHT
jgi:hypothetical protein